MKNRIFLLEIVEDEENQLKASDEELEEDVFRRRKVELVSGVGELKYLKSFNQSNPQVNTSATVMVAYL